jgi:adenylate cyclase
VLRDAQAGEFTQRIPILTQNELGLMGIQLNRLVDYVHDREKVEQMLRKVVSPDIMEKLLTTDTETLKHGEQRDVAILFCDIRGFTEMSEATSAEEVILFLNTFFSELSEIVSRYNGIINKFMGDAILAVYSTEHPAWAIDNAMATALDIAKRVSQLKLPDGSPAEAGVGIHFGRVVAGTIGSDQRYEYTFLGDAVNTASRLEGLSKRLGHTIIVSAAAYQMLSSPLKSSLVDLGQHQVRGKAELLHIFGGPIGD